MECQHSITCAPQTISENVKSENSEFMLVFKMFIVIVRVIFTTMTTLCDSILYHHILSSL